MSKKSTHGPVENEAAGAMLALADAINMTLNGDAPPEKRQWGFALLVFRFGEEGERVNYVSNADRESMLLAMKEFISRAEGRIGDGEQLQ